ncbi:MAG: TetR family transcriptional regulator [Gammaproteobacteria bacterium]|nr:TetR family transcriptional regulator [Gammaproteobacteria bacterium]
MNAPTNGKMRLIEAALRLAARKRSFSAIGLRELAREAGLNPNTFYRHFADLDGLALFILEYIADSLRQRVRSVRLTAHNHEQAIRETVGLAFDYAAANPEAMTVAVREIHGASPVLRSALRRLLNRVAQDMYEDVMSRGLAPGLREESIAEISRVVIWHMFFRALDYLEYPEQRAAIVAETERFIWRQFAAGVMEANGKSPFGLPPAR